MALRFMDSFDHYALAELSTKWGSTSESFISLPSGRNGSCINFNSLNSFARKTFSDSQATWIVGFAYKQTSVAENSEVVFLEDSGTVHISLGSLIGGQMRVRRGVGGTILGTTAGAVLTGGSWHYVELKVTISDASGVVVLRVDGATHLNLSSQDTRNGANATANALRLGGTGSNNVDQWAFDDLYVCDGTGSAPTNDFLGDSRVEVILPNGNGNSSQFDGSDGNSTDNYLLVDETSPDEETTYVESPDVGDKDTYAYGNLATASGTVYGIQPIPRLRKTDAGVRSAVSVARLSGTEVDSAANSLSSAYIYYPDIRETKPGGGSWTVSDVNSSEFGIKVNA